MLTGQPFNDLPVVPNFTKFSVKLALGVVFITFLLSYQPYLGFPPVKRSLAQADTQQTQQVQAQSLPFEFKLPHPGYISTHFSTYHPGVDLASGLGIAVKPIAPGKVIEAGFNFWGLGLVVEIEHEDGFSSLYAHLGKLYVQKGQEVKSGDSLGEVGLTGHTSGPHTHLELSKDGKKIDPLTVLPKVRDYPTEEDFKIAENK